MKNRKLKAWREELDRCVAETGISLERVSEYMGLSYQNEAGFYVKIPRKRTTFIGIGMGFGQPLYMINRWIVEYGNKRALYSKDITEDLIWIYLIERNEAEGTEGTNYYTCYDQCRDLAYETYMNLWNDIVTGNLDTHDVDKSLTEIRYEPQFADLKDFVIDNMDAFKTAYSKPRRMLADYVNSILASLGRRTDAEGEVTLSSLRGFLDDSMINYLSGSVETINVANRETWEKTPNIKKVPKSKRSHISIALALGMPREEIDRYLELMGFTPLDEEIREEAPLIRMLAAWEEKHPLHVRYVDRYIRSRSVRLKPEEEQQIVDDMMMRRQELKEMYDGEGRPFPYLKE